VHSFHRLESIRKELDKIVFGTTTEKTGPPVDEPMIETAPPQHGPSSSCNPSATVSSVPRGCACRDACPAVQHRIAKCGNTAIRGRAEELEEECTVATIAAVADCEAVWKKCVTVVKTADC